MFREMIRASQDLPLFEEGIDYVRVVLSGGAPRTTIARFVAQLPAEERDDTDSMLVLFTLCQRRTITAAEISKILQKGSAETELVLRRLSADSPGILEPTRESARTRNPKYRLRADVLKALGAAVRYHRRTTDAVDRNVITHMEEYGKISNRTLQNLFDIRRLARTRPPCRPSTARDCRPNLNGHPRAERRIRTRRRIPPPAVS